MLSNTALLNLNNRFPEGSYENYLELYNKGICELVKLEELSKGHIELNNYALVRRLFEDKLKYQITPALESSDPSRLKHKVVNKFIKEYVIPTIDKLILTLSSENILNIGNQEKIKKEYIKNLKILKLCSYQIDKYALTD